MITALQSARFAIEKNLRQTIRKGWIVKQNSGIRPQTLPNAVLAHDYFSKYSSFKEEFAGLTERRLPHRPVQRITYCLWWKGAIPAHSYLYAGREVQPCKCVINSDLSVICAECFYTKKRALFKANQETNHISLEFKQACFD